ncbi:MAG: C40 family peptidase [Akkermansiaceae bacterium]|nr:C40 family peptidase [Armatimonadota bacterium]
MNTPPSSSDTGTPIRTVTHNVVHLCETPTNSSEMVSQLLMGQTVRIVREENGWSYVEGEDTYRGWADNRWLGELVTDELEPVVVPFADLRIEPDFHAPLRLRVPMFARLRIESATEGGWIEVSTPDRAIRGYLHGASNAFRPLASVPLENKTEVAAVFSQSFLGTPYLWGGSSSFGLDCSGFVQYCHQMVGITLRRDADIQRDDPRFVSAPVANVAEAGRDLLPGDLVFFGKPDRITHVGMHLAGNTFIHSAGGAGVIVTQWGDERYSPGFVDARRLDPARALEPVSRFESETR